MDDLSGRDRTFDIISSDGFLLEKNWLRVMRELYFHLLYVFFTLYIL